MYLIEILHQTTTPLHTRYNFIGCILSKFYIKPQLRHKAAVFPIVVSYRNSTSNHNYKWAVQLRRGVVSYRNSTSNHNATAVRSKSSQVVSYRNSTSNHNKSLISMLQSEVVSYRNSTSNHNWQLRWVISKVLYLIEILHQTTTTTQVDSTNKSCILSKFYIKPQLDHLQPRVARSCILSKFYIKPQRRCRRALRNLRCILSKFYIKPQLPTLLKIASRRCILSKFYIKPQRSEDAHNL